MLDFFFAESPSFFLARTNLTTNLPLTSLQTQAVHKQWRDIGKEIVEHYRKMDGVTALINAKQVTNG